MTNRETKLPPMLRPICRQPFAALQNCGASLPNQPNSRRLAHDRPPARPFASMHARPRTLMHTYMHIRPHAPPVACSHARTPARTPVRTPVRTHALTPARPPTRMHAHRYSPSERVGALRVLELSFFDDLRRQYTLCIFRN